MIIGARETLDDDRQDPTGQHRAERRGKRRNCIEVFAVVGVEYILHPEKFQLAKNIIPIYAKEEGYVKSIDALEIGLSSMTLGGGRETLDDIIDMSAGIMLNKKVGDYVKEGEVLCYLHSNKNVTLINRVAKNVFNAFVVSKEFVEKPKVILEIIQ